MNRLLFAALLISCDLPQSTQPEDCRPIVFMVAGEWNAAGAVSSEQLGPTEKLIPANVVYWRNGERPESFGADGTWGPEISIAHGLATQYLSRMVILIKRATSRASSLYAGWRPDWNENRAAVVIEPDHQFKMLAADVEFAVGGLDVAWGALFWVQGETDATDRVAGMYYSDGLEELSQGLWDRIGVAFPLILARVDPPPDGHMYVLSVRYAIQQSGFPWVDCDDLPRLEGGLLFDATGQRELGTRLMNAYLRASAANHCLCRPHQ